MAFLLKVVQCGFMTLLCWVTFPVVISNVVDVPNIAHNMDTKQSSSFSSQTAPDKAVDGNFNSNLANSSCSHTSLEGRWHWWMVELGDIAMLSSIRITNRADCCSEQLRDFRVEISTTDPFDLDGFPGRTDAPVCFTRTAPVPPQSVNFDCDEPLEGRFIRVVKEGSLTLCEFEAFPSRLPFAPINLALHMPAFQSSTRKEYVASAAVDGDTNAALVMGSCTQTDDITGWHWWSVDLQEVYTIAYVRITKRADCCREATENISVVASLRDPSSNPSFPALTPFDVVCFTRIEPLPSVSVTFACDKPIEGRYIRVMKIHEGSTALSFCEVEIFEARRPTTTTMMESTDLAIDAPNTERSVPDNAAWGSAEILGSGIMADNTSVIAEATTGGAVVAPTKEKTTIIPQPSVEEEEERGRDTSGQHDPKVAGKKASWTEQWKQWKTWLAEGRTGETELSSKSKCSICC